MLRAQDVTIIGRVSRLHGYKGQVKVNITRPDASDIETEWVMLMINNKPVPFFIVERSGSDQEWILSLEDIDNEQKAERLKGLALGVDASLIADPELTETEGFIGFTVATVHGQSLGTVDAVSNTGTQDILHVKSENSEFMIPYVPEFIVEVMKKKRSLIVELPEGLTTLNK